MRRLSLALLFGGTGVVGMLFVLSIFGIIGAFCWPYTINTWLVFVGKVPKVLWWHGFILGYIPWFGTLSIPAAIVTWVLMLFLV